MGGTTHYSKQRSSWLNVVGDGSVELRSRWQIYIDWNLGEDWFHLVNVRKFPKFLNGHLSTQKGVVVLGMFILNPVFVSLVPILL